MPYIGKSPLHGNYQKLDDFSGDFDGSDATHALAQNSLALTPVTEAALIISINGVIQEPVTDYTVSGTNITFTTAPASGASFFGVVLGEQLAIGTPSDATVTSVHLASTFFTGATDVGAAIVDADLFLMDDGAGGTLRKTAASRLKTYAGGGGSDPASADGDTLGTASLEWSDLYLADGGVIYFGNDQEIKVTHSADSGLLLKHTATTDDKPISLTLQTGETDMAANDIIGAINFQAPDEGTGTDAVKVAAAIKAYAEGDFSSSSNATTLGFYTGLSDTAAIRMTLSSAGALDVTGDITGSTINADGDTSTGDTAAMGYTSVLGAILTGQGSTNDVTLVNDADATVLGIPTGTTNVTIAGDLTLTGTTPTLTIGDAGTEDTSIVFDGNAQDYYIGLDDTDDDLKIGLGSTVGTTAHIVMDETGAVTKPLQPSFMVQPSATQSNIAVGVATTVTWDTEIYDIGGDFASNVFTAPVTGKYLFCVNIEMNQIDTAAAHYRIQMVFSNRTMQSWVMTPNFASDTTLWPACFSTHMDMDAGDTIEMRFDQPDGTAQTDISVSSFYTGSLLS